MSDLRRSVLLAGTWRSLLACAVTTCTTQTESPLARAEFGVMFGGQCQERVEIPFELDANKQALGFVIELRQPADTALPVHWEVSKPGPLTNGLSNPLSRRTELFDNTWPAGQREFRQPIAFSPGDQLGTWNVRVVVGNHVAIDRPFWVFDPDVRARQPQADAGLQ
jgi:hypothetical protein